MQQSDFQHIHSISVFINDHLLAIKEQFIHLIQIQNQSKWLPQHWALLSSYSLSLITRNLVSQMKHHFNVWNPGQLEQLIDLVMKDPTISFLIQWLTKTQTYKDHNFKDRKNSFFRLLSKYLKKMLKGRICENQSSILRNLQESLNHNTISNKQVKEVEILWKDPINLYLNSQQLLADIITKNKSNASRYFYLLHLPEIKQYAAQEILADFPFYEKLDLKCSMRRIIGTLCGVLPLERTAKMDEMDSRNMYSCQMSNVGKNCTLDTNFIHYDRNTDEEIFCVLDLGYSLDQQPIGVLNLGYNLDPGQQPIGVKDNHLLPRLQNASENTQHSHASYK